MLMMMLGYGCWNLGFGFPATSIIMKFQRLQFKNFLDFPPRYQTVMDSDV
ncbi:Protein of unknown function [Pyronema omphalodes CBS 100304]|uniref:Uncharacterized protein n=1 Tax=Pyronema omphalodes (strain CBS 100304) TaxID=1076935 RepID=U4LLQ5_PYROM|nr:Protein of unknown function [Pyronema omphalodes CBS 100304]